MELKRYMHCAVGIILLALGGGAHATVSNGDFEIGALSPWTVFTTANGSLGNDGASVTSFDVAGGGTESSAFAVSVGYRSAPCSFVGIFCSYPVEGGGIRQIVNFAGGMTAITADLAVNNSDLYAAPYPFEVSYHRDPGTFSVLVDGRMLANHTFAPILSGTVQRAQLQAFADISAGAHTLEFLITRSWAPSLSLTQYIDNISVSAVPEPGIVALFGSGLITLLVVGRAKRRAIQDFSPRAAK